MTTESKLHSIERRLEVIEGGIGELHGLLTALLNESRNSSRNAQTEQRNLKSAVDQLDYDIRQLKR